MQTMVFEPWTKVLLAHLFSDVKTLMLVLSFKVHDHGLIMSNLPCDSYMPLSDRDVWGQQPPLFCNEICSINLDTLVYIFNYIFNNIICNCTYLRDSCIIHIQPTVDPCSHHCDCIGKAGTKNMTCTESKAGRTTKTGRQPQDVAETDGWRLPNHNLHRLRRVRPTTFVVESVFFGCLAIVCCRLKLFAWLDLVAFLQTCFDYVLCAGQSCPFRCVLFLAPDRWRVTKSGFLGWGERERVEPLGAESECVFASVTGFVVLVLLWFLVFSYCWSLLCKRECLLASVPISEVNSVYCMTVAIFLHRRVVTSAGAVFSLDPLNHCQVR